jgi:hypothetical protein
MAGAKKKSRPRSAASASHPTSSHTRRKASARKKTPVRSSSALGTAEASRRLGISPATLRRRAAAGTIRATIDAAGHYHFPGLRKKKASGRKKTSRKVLPEPKAQSPKPKARPRPPFRKKRAPAKKSAVRKKILASARRPASSPAPVVSRPPRKKKFVGKKARAVPPPALPRKKVKKLPGKVAPAARAVKKPLRKKTPRLPELPRKKKKRPGKKAAKKIVRRKKKRAPSHRPIPEVADRERPTLTEVVRETRAAIAEGRFAPFGVPVDLREPDPSAPLTVDEAAQRMGPVMRDYVMARFQWERDLTHDQFWAMKFAFKKTYGVREWRRVFDWIVDEWSLEDYIFDREALRDS